MSKTTEGNTAPGPVAGGAADSATGTVPRLGLRPREAAAALGISRRKLWEITADRTSGIPVIRLGRSILYPVEALRNWLAGRIERR